MNGVVGYANQAYRYVVDETMENGLVCVRTLGWANSNKGSLVSLKRRPGWANPRYQEIADKEAEFDRPTRWLISDMTPLPEYVPAPANASVKNIVREQLMASIEEPSFDISDDDDDWDFT